MSSSGDARDSEREEERSWNEPEVPNLNIESSDLLSYGLG